MRTARVAKLKTLAGRSRRVQLAWSPWGALWSLAALFALAMAALVLFTRPDRAQNRCLAALLAIEGAYAGASAFSYFAANAPDALTAFRLLVAIGLAEFAAYLLFLGTMDVPLTKPLRLRPVRIALILLAFALPLAFLARPALVVAGVEPGALGAWDLASGPLYPAVVLGGLAVFALSIATSFAAFRAAPRGSPARERAQAYLTAFLVFDGYWGLNAVTGILAPSNMGATAVRRALAPIADLLWASLLAWGILRAQLFDIDVKLKLGIQRGSVAFVIVGVFIVGSQVAQNYLQQYGVIVGGIAAGLLLFAIQPLQKMAERVADAALPNVKTGSPAYAAYRKLEVYRAAVESAMEEGGIDVRERAVLERLRAKLGILPEDARQIEGDVGDRPSSARLAA